jgi:trigger factor
VRSEVEWREHDIGHQLESAGMSVEDYLRMEDQSREDFDAEIRRNAETAVKTQLVLDALAEREQLGVSETDLSQHVVRQAGRYGVSPQAYADRMAEAGNLPALVAEVRRSKALAYALDQATVTDGSGRPVDLSALRRDADADGGGADSDSAAANGSAADGAAADGAAAGEAVTGEAATGDTATGDTATGVEADAADAGSWGRPVA